MFSLFSLPITVSGIPVANGSIVLTLVGGPATIISTGGAAPSFYIFNLDANGNPPASMQAWGNAELSPAGTTYTYAVWSGANGTGSVVIGPFTGIVGPSAPFAGTLYPNLTVLPLLSFSAINGVNVTGTPTAGQILTATGGTAANWQNPSFDASRITSGQLALARGGTNADLSATGGASQVLKQVSTGAVITVGQLAFSDISGVTALAHGGTNADLSATGGASQVLKQTSAGAAITVGQLAASDLSNSTTGSGAVVLATSPSLTTPKIGTETISSAPRMTWGIDFIANGNANSGAYKQWVLDKGITITRIDIVYAGVTGLGSTTSAKLRVTDGTTNTDVSMTNGAASDTSGAISVNYSAGATLQIKTVAGVGYTQNPTNITITVQYKMQ